jgi:hypothetical protein
MKATKRLIDSVWTVEFHQVSETEVEILKYSREDPEGYEHERELPQCRIVENADRTAVALLIRDKFDSFTWCDESNCNHRFIIKNPKHIFDYKS